MAVVRVPVEQAVAAFRRKWPDFELPTAPDERRRKAVPRRESRLVRPLTDKQMVSAYLRAKLGPRLTEEQAAERLAICRRNECGHYRRACKGREFCGGCGCEKMRQRLLDLLKRFVPAPLLKRLGENLEADAELPNKARMARAECPCEPSLWRNGGRR